MGRDLLVVLRMLHRSGIDAGILVTRDELFIVWLKEPCGGIVDAGYFRLEEVVCLKKGGTECYAATGENKYHAIFGGGPSYIVHPSD